MHFCTNKRLQGTAKVRLGCVYEARDILLCAVHLIHLKTCFQEEWPTEIPSHQEKHGGRNPQHFIPHWSKAINVSSLLFLERKICLGNNILIRDWHVCSQHHF